MAPVTAAPSSPATPTSVVVPSYDTNSNQPPDNIPLDNLTTSADTADPDEERRAIGEARAHRRLVKNLILGSICLVLLLATLWVLLVVGPL